METEDKLRHESEIADAQLGVAEKIGWLLALFAGFNAYLIWDYWIVAIVVTLVFYTATVSRYRKNAAKIEDTYYRAAKLGKYAE